MNLKHYTEINKEHEKIGNQNFKMINSTVYFSLVDIKVIFDLIAFLYQAVEKRMISVSKKWSTIFRNGGSYFFIFFLTQVTIHFYLFIYFKL